MLESKRSYNHIISEKDFQRTDVFKKIVRIAKNARINAIKMTSKSGASHIASALSVVDIIATLYGGVMKYDIKNPKSTERDIFILSKGHSGVALYSVLAQVGFFEIQDLDNYYTYGSLLSGHVSHKVSGVEFSTGALGHGLSVATGIAYSFKLDKKPNQVYVVIGDGECNEGQIWEAIMLAVQLKLDNLHIIVDRNRMQALGYGKDIIDLNQIEEKFKVFGCNVECCNGHSYYELFQKLQIQKKEIPTVIVAQTVKGKGVSFMEDKLLWHYRNPSAEDVVVAQKELEEYYAQYDC